MSLLGHQWGTGTWGPGDAPFLQAPPWHHTPLPVLTAPPAPASSTGDIRAAGNSSLGAPALHGMGTMDIPVPTGATSSVPEPNLEAMLGGDTKGQAHRPLPDAAEDTGTNPTGLTPIPAGLQSNVPLRPEEKLPARDTVSSTNMFRGQLHLAGCCFCCLCVPQDA